VLILVQDLNITIINAATGELLRQLTLDPTTDYQPTGAPKGPKRSKPRPGWRRDDRDVGRPNFAHQRW
jgi:hypothetical protein